MKEQNKLFWYAAGVTFLWLLILWVVKIIEIQTHSNFVQWGVYPRYMPALKGIISMHFIHGTIDDSLWSHLSGNSLSLIPLAFSVFYFFRQLAWRVVIFLHLISGFWLWSLGGIANDLAWHVGASAVIYGLAFFLFFSGIFRKDRLSIAIAMLVALFHGNMLWGTMPFFTQEGVSWEGHLFGGLAGILLAFYYRKKFHAPEKKYSWDYEPDSKDISGPWDYRNQNPPPEGFEHP